MLTSIRFRNFRNLGDATWEPGGGPHLLLGSNGAGKTSLLESLYLVATTRSFRTARVEECRRTGCAEFSLSGMVDSTSRSELEFAWKNSGRSRKLNGNNVTTARYLEALPVVSWSAGDLKVIEGGPRHRRRFLDQGVVSRRPAAVEVLSRYRRAVDQKRELLRQGMARAGPDLTAWNELLADAAHELIARRSEFVLDLERQVASIVLESRLELPEITLRYCPSPADQETTRERVFETFESLRNREIDERRVLIGPHRDELEILWNGVEASRIASAGEKKLLGLLLCAARGRMLAGIGREPILLLDDLDAELDRDRLEASWRLFDGSPQVFASSCHDPIAESLQEARIWHLESGLITAA